MDETEYENLDKNLRIAVKAITLVCAISSAKCESGIPDPIMVKAFAPLLELTRELETHNPEIEFDSLNTLIKTCEMEINEAILSLKAKFLGEDN